MPSSWLIVGNLDMTPRVRSPVRSHRRRSGMFHPRDFLDWVFEIGIVLKASTVCSSWWVVCCW
jgi:hypothetical protein